MSVPSPSSDTTGEYRLRETASTVGNYVVLTRPLTVTRLNQPAIDLLEHLRSGEYRSPESIATVMGFTEDIVKDLFERLHRRGFLEWRPKRDPEFHPPVSVVVTVRDDRENLERCLDTLAELTYPRYEVVVVDDGSTDGTRNVATDHKLATAGHLRLISVGTPNEPLGIGASRNRGVEAAANDVIAFTDADCRPRPEWLDDLVPILAHADLVGGRIRPAGTTAASVYEGINSSLDMGAYASRVDPNGDTPYLATANLVGRRAVFEAVPFPDRNVAEDVEVSWRAVRSGFDVVYTPTGVVEHRYRSAVRTFAGRRSTYGASEALLASTHDNDGERREISITHLFVVLLGLAGVVLSERVLVGVSLTLTLLVGIVGGIHLWGRYRQLPPTVSVVELAGSWGRERLSTLYTFSVEVTRYYAIPITIVGFLTWFAGVPRATTVLLAGVGTAVILPAIVEYWTHRPAVSVFGYLSYYLADHLGYQYGVYRGAITHRTISHVHPSARFQLVGPGTGFLRQIRSTPTTDPVRTVSVGNVSAQFGVESNPEEWWFEDDSLQAERLVLEELIDRLRPGDVFYDIGANIGLYSCLVHRRLKEGAIVAFEPHPPNAERLSENLARNDIDARVVRKALGSTNGYGTLTNPEGVSGSGTNTLVGTTKESEVSVDSIRREALSSEPPTPASPDSEAPTAPSRRRQPHSTRVTTGDSLVQADTLPRPTVMKIDVEGTELDVLHGLRQTLTEGRCRLVYCELHPNALAVRGTSPDAVRGFLRDCGFAVDTIQQFTDGRAIVRAQKCE